MDDSAYGIHKDHYFLLENLGGISKVSDIAKPKYSYDLLPRYDGIHAPRALHILSYNLGAGFTKSQGEKSTNVDDCLLKHISLEHYIALWLLLLLAAAPPLLLFCGCLLILEFFHGDLLILLLLSRGQGILCNSRYFQHHLLDRIDH